MSICDMFTKNEILIVDTWNEDIKKSDGIVDLFFYCKFNIRMPLGWHFKEFKKFIESCSLPKVATMSSTYLQ